MLAKTSGEELAKVGVVVDDENTAKHHGVSPCSRSKTPLQRNDAQDVCAPATAPSRSEGPALDFAIDWGITIPKDEHTEAYEVLAGADPRLLLTCEHASDRLPSPWAWPEADAWITGTHWASDLGARDLTRGLSAALSAPAILSRFTRLLVDPNRPLASPTLFRAEAEGRVIQLNQEIDPRERERRLADYYRPYHRRIDRALRESPRAALLSVHTFTPFYEGEARSVEIGALFDQNPALGERFAAELSARGWRTALNEPYSGAQGFAFSPEDHGARHRRPALELELRQDLALDQDRRAKLLDDLVAATRRTYGIDP